MRFGMDTTHKSRGRETAPGTRMDSGGYQKTQPGSASGRTSVFSPGRGWDAGLSAHVSRRT